MISNGPFLRLLLVALPAALTGVGAAPAPAPTPAAKQAFLARPVIYAQFDITVTGTRAFGTGTPANALADGAFRTTQSVRFEVPFDMPSAGSPPMSSMPLSTADMMDQDRFMTWFAMPPADDSSVEQALTTGTVDLAKSPMFLPAVFSIDDLSQRRHRDMPTDGWGTDTRTTKGKGIVYLSRTGTLACDLKKMTCDLGGVMLSFQDGIDRITVTTTSDVPGFVAKSETTGPSHLLARFPNSMTTQLQGFAITLPEPSTLTLTGRSDFENYKEAGVYTLKVTLSSKPGPKVAPAGQPAAAAPPRRPGT